MGPAARRARQRRARVHRLALSADAQAAVIVPVEGSSTGRVLHHTIHISSRIGILSTTMMKKNVQPTETMVLTLSVGGTRIRAKYQCQCGT